jgi:hypothetical protein
MHRSRKGVCSHDVSIHVDCVRYVLCAVTRLA